MSKGSARRPGAIAQDRWDAIFNKKANVRHDLDPELVQFQVHKKLAELENTRRRLREQQKDLYAQYMLDKRNGRADRWSKVPDEIGHVDPMIDEWVAHERDHYAKVRVIELPQEGNRFVLAYGDIADADVTSGTGPFETPEKAKAWFLNGGR